MRRNRQQRPDRVVRACHPATRSGPLAASDRPNPFPLRTHQILELQRVKNIAIIDGRIGQIGWSDKRGTAADFIEVKGVRHRVKWRSLQALLHRALQLDDEALRQWACAKPGDQDNYCGLEQRFGKREARTVSRQVEDFIFQQLIPHLKTRSHKAQTSISPPNLLELQLLRHWGKNLAFYDSSCYALVPYFGRTKPGEFHLKVDGQHYKALDRTLRDAALDHYDQLLQKTVQRFFGDSTRDTDTHTLYRDPVYSILRIPRGEFFLCQQMPPYVVETDNGKLYPFPAVELGIPIADLRPTQVVHAQSVQTMHPYRHMFLFGDRAGERVCMPRPKSYFEQLHRLPLAEALLEHLDSARTTLCAGLNGSSPYHSVKSLGLSAISQREAHRRDLPIYRFRRQA